MTDVEALAAQLGHVPTEPTWPADTTRPPVPMALFGADHWSTFAYVETRAVDHRGQLAHDHMRCHGGRHPMMLGAKHAVRGLSADGSRYPTKIKASETPDAAGLYGVADLADHDDYDCLDDLVAAGLLEPRMPTVGPDGYFVDVYGRAITATRGDEVIRPEFVTGMSEQVLARHAVWTLTDIGRRIAAQLRGYKANRGVWRNFRADPGGVSHGFDPACAEPADDTVVIITDGGCDDKLIYGRNDSIATGNARWADLTELPTDRHRTTSTWTGLTSTALAVQHLGGVVDPAGDEPADDTWLAVKRAYKASNDVYWYLAHRDDSRLPTAEEIREENGPLDDIADPAERKEQEDDEAHQLAANWSINSCFAEWAAQWAAMVGDGTFTWQELAVEGNPDITITVYAIA